MHSDNLFNKLSSRNQKVTDGHTDGQRERSTSHTNTVCGDGVHKINTNAFVWVWVGYKRSYHYFCLTSKSSNMLYGAHLYK